MKTRKPWISGSMIVLCLVIFSFPAQGNDEDSTLIRYLPDDVFMCVLEKHNPDKAFLTNYWNEVMETLKQSGVGEDMIEMLQTLLGMLNQEQVEELTRLKDRAFKLVENVNWSDLGGKEVCFSERFVAPVTIDSNKPPFMMPAMVWIFQGTKEGAAHNYKGLAAIMEALADEVNALVGVKRLNVVYSTRMEAQVASLDFLPLTGYISAPLTLALKDDLIVIGMREGLVDDSLALINGNGKKKPLTQDPQFKAAFAQLPPASDTLSYFKMQGLVAPMFDFFNTIVGMNAGHRDVFRNRDMDQEAAFLNAKALNAYQKGDLDLALAITRDAYKRAPSNSIVLYNLACFNTLAGNKEEGLTWLHKAVDGGFYAYNKIANDADLTSLRKDPRFMEALNKAARLSAKTRVRDMVENFASDGEVFRLRMQANQTYETKDYEQGLKICQQALAINPEDSKVLYTMGCLHALLGHEDTAYKFLEIAVEGGFYCPKHMSKDPDLECLRHQDRFKALLKKAENKAVDMMVRNKNNKIQHIQKIFDRMAQTAGIMEYVAEVHGTKDFKTTKETIVALAPNAKERAIYPVFGKAQTLTNFERFLPKETAAFSISGGIDLVALYDFIVDTIAMIGDEGKNILGQLDFVQKQIGINIREDIMGWIGEESIEVTLEGGGSVTFIKVKDEEKARETMAKGVEFVTTKLHEIVGQKPELAGLAMLGLRTSKVRNERLPGFQNIHMTFSPQPGVWGVANGYLIFGTSADAILMCLDTAKGAHPNIRENERAMAEAVLPNEGGFSQISLKDMRNLGKQMAEGLGIVTMVTGMMSAFIPEPELKPFIAKISSILGKLAPVAQKIDFYKSSASCTVFDGKAWRSRSVTHYFSPEERANRNK